MTKPIQWAEAAYTTPVAHSRGSTGDGFAYFGDRADRQVCAEAALELNPIGGDRIMLEGTPEEILELLDAAREVVVYLFGEDQR